MKKFVLMVLLAAIPVSIKAACVPLANGLRLGIPAYSDSGPVWANCIIQDLINLNFNSGGGGSGGSSGLTFDNFLPQVNGSTNTFQLSTTAFTSSSIFIIRDGLLLSGASDYTYTPPTQITLTVTPSTHTTSLYASYFKIPASTQPTSGPTSNPSDVSFTGHNTHAGQEDFNSTTTFSLNIASNSVPVSGALYKKFIPFATALFSASGSSITTYGAVNVTSMSYISSGFYRMNFATPASSSKLGVLCTCHNNQYMCAMDADTNTLSSHSVSILTLSSAGNQTDGLGLPCMVEVFDYGNTVQ